jgi:hypothetical protein
MSKTTTKLDDGLTDYHFDGGPFHRHAYRLPAPHVERGSDPMGSLVMTIPRGVGVPSGLAWGDIVVSRQADPRPMNPAQFVRYRLVDGQWQYIAPDMSETH